jgi:transposase
MAFFSDRKDKKTGVVYRYRVESYWDKEKKAPRNRQVYIGRIDPDTGELTPPRRKLKKNRSAESSFQITATAKVIGPYLLLEKIAEKHGITKLLKRCFGEDAAFIQSLVYFIVQKGVALSRAEAWSATNLHPLEEILDSRRISELLRRISEDARLNFLRLWMEQVLEKDTLCYDITSVSSYARNNEYTHYGYNRDNESLAQINLAMLFTQHSKLPVYFRRMPGNISDVATLKTTIKSLDYLGATAGMHLVLDRGFFSISNIDELYHRKHKFTIATPAGRKWVERIIDNYIDDIASPSNYLTIDKEEALYAVTKLHKWGENRHRCYVHIYFNATRAAEDFDKLTRKMITLKEELESGQLNEKHQELYDRFFVIRETPKRGRKIYYNEEAIQNYRKRYSGFFCIISNKIKSAIEALETYRRKDIVENSFDDLKNHLDMKRLRVHNSVAMDSRLFLQFIALIFASEIRKVKKNNKDTKHLSVREVMEHMETLSRIKCSNRYGQVYTESSPLQRSIMEAFGIALQS